MAGLKGNKMTQKAWFCYEKGSMVEDFHPVVYYGEVPKSDSHGRKQVVEISHLPRNEEGEYSFAELVRLYPLKIEQEK